jgi:uncharacterized membrane protein
MNTKTRNLTATALMVAITLILGLTVGFIPIPMGIFEITLMCVPVIIGTIILGWKQGLILGFVFGATSLYKGMTGPMASLIGQYPFALVPSIFIPRLLIPITVWLMYKATLKLPTVVGLGISSAVGSLTNTVFFLGMIYLLGGYELAKILQLIIKVTLSLNATVEMLIALVICVPIIIAVRQIYKKE